MISMLLEWYMTLIYECLEEIMNFGGILKIMVVYVLS